MHNILVPVLHIFIEADVPGTQDRPRSWCVYYSSRIYSSSKLRLNSSQCNSTIVRKSVRGICIQSKALHSFGACTYNQRNNDLRKVNFDTSCIRTTYKGDKGDKEGSTWLHAWRQWGRQGVAGVLGWGRSVAGAVFFYSFQWRSRSWLMTLNTF